MTAPQKMQESAEGHNIGWPAAARAKRRGLGNPADREIQKRTAEIAEKKVLRVIPQVEL
jgi:hypothetical protein